MLFSKSVKTLVLALALSASLTAQAEDDSFAFQKKKAGSRVLKGEEARHLFEILVVAGFKTKNLENWQIVDKVSVSSGKISCAYEHGGFWEEALNKPNCGENITTERAYLLKKIARHGSNSILSIIGSYDVTDVTCVVKFDHEGRYLNPAYSCRVKFPESTIDIAE